MGISACQRWQELRFVVGGFTGLDLVGFVKCFRTQSACFPLIGLVSATRCWCRPVATRTARASAKLAVEGRAWVASRFASIGLGRRGGRALLAQRPGRAGCHGAGA